VASFDLGARVRAERATPLSPQRAWTLGRALIAGYADDGFAVDFLEENCPRAIRARLTHAEGSDIQAAMSIAARNGGGAVIAVALTGAVEVGGMEAVFASAALVQTMAQQKLDGMLDVVLAEAAQASASAAGEAGEADDGAAGASAAPGAARAENASAATAGQPASAATGSVAGRLLSARRMFEEGLIDADDYRAARGRILESL
jgi:hypothetical protein